MSGLISEAAILERMDRHFANTRAGITLGRGDDCAILETRAPICASTDLFLEDVHFRMSYFEPEEVGAKALTVNLSDLAAMGARPLAFQLGLGLSDAITPQWLDRFFCGMAKLARETGIILCGGDISRASGMQICITVMGEQQDNCNLLLRGGSMRGDAIFVVGKPGLARAGFFEMEEHGRAALGNWPEACAALLRPKAHLDAGLMLARAAHNARPPALMDVSDGLGCDLPRLLGQKPGISGPGAELRPPKALLHPELLAWAQARQLDPWLEMYKGGEDYILLGSCAPDMLGALHAAIPGFCHIGEVTSTGRIFLHGRDVTHKAGFDHFAAA